MERRKNDLDHKMFEETRRRVEAEFPYGVKKGFYIKDFKGASVLGGMAKVAVSAVVNIVGDSLHLRTYREPKSSIAGVRYKVDERRDINKEEIVVLRGSEVSNHYIPHEVPEDMMAHNNITIEVVYDGAGGLKPNIAPDGTAPAYINFSDPMPETLRVLSAKAVEAQQAAMLSENSPKDTPPAAA